jgi:hypothetical protein
VRQGASLAEVWSSAEDWPQARARELRGAVAAGILALQNLAIFGLHYAGIFGFPWDFNGTYYAVPAFWTTAVARGILPRWIPFSAGGYPFALNLQSGFFYPPFWIFPAFDVPYTLRAAVAFQCLHVLAGAIGMYLLARLVLADARIALVAAAAYQLFGGFYSNAEHADIVRAFALLPWFLFALTRRSEEGTRLPARAWSLPLIVYLLATGGYPFALPAALLLGSAYGLAEVAGKPGGPRTLKRIVSLGAAYSGLALLGVAMAFVQLAPSWIHREEIARWHHHGSLPLTGIGIRQLPGFVFRSSAVPGEVSMTSTYVSVLLLAAFAMLRWKDAKRHAGFLVLLAAGALMAAGAESPLYRLAVRAVPPLGISRFPASDYRAFPAIALILLGAVALRQAAREGISRRRYAAGAAIAVAAFGWCALQVRGPVGIFGFGQAGALLALSLALLFFAAGRRGIAGKVAVLAVALVFADGARFLIRQPGWWVRDPDSFVPAPGRGRSTKVPVAPAPLTPVASRPPRISAPSGNFAASGYLLGEFGVYEVETAVLQAKRRTDQNDAECEYLRRGWEPRVMRVDSRQSTVDSRGNRDVRLPLEFFEEPAAREAQVRLVEYGADRIRYEVELPAPALLVENELFFEGWTARLDESRERISPARVNGIWRSWPLPAGRHRMTAEFGFPGFAAMAAVSAAAWLSWVLLLLRRGWRSGLRSRRVS